LLGRGLWAFKAAAVFELHRCPRGVPHFDTRVYTAKITRAYSRAYSPILAPTRAYSRLLAVTRVYSPLLAITRHFSLRRMPSGASGRRITRKIHAKYSSLLIPTRQYSSLLAFTHYYSPLHANTHGNSLILAYSITRVYTILGSGGPLGKVYLGQALWEIFHPWEAWFPIKGHP